MSARVRKFVGMYLLIFGLLAYVVLVVSLATAPWMPKHWAVQVLLFAVAGVAWAIPMRPFMAWVNKPDPE